MHGNKVTREGNTVSCALAPVGERQSVGGLLVRNVERFGAHPVLMEKQEGRYRSLAWSRFLLEVVGTAAFLREHGVGPGERVALITRNRREALVLEFAVMGLGAIHVPIFVGYPGDQTDVLLRHAMPVVVAVAGPEQLSKIHAPASVRRILTFDRTTSPEGTVWFGSLPIPPDPHEPVVHAMVDQFAAVSPDAPALMMYTSGTSGEQKGVVLTHDNILSQQRALGVLWNVTSEDRILTYLPWHHSFGGIFEKYTALYNGATLAIDDSFGKDLALLLENWKTIRPTVYFSVPMIHQQLVDHVRLHPEEEDEIYHDGIRFVFTAAAPLPANISEFFEAKNIPVVEGWGLTETAPCCTLTDMTERRRTPGMVGYPIPGVTVRIADDGEILVRGPNVMRGYFGNEEATLQAFPGDGWFHTGDLGELLPGGGLKLLTRKDRIFKLLNAEKVIPTGIENELAGRNKYIRHILVVGKGQRFLAALIFPNTALIEEEFGADGEAAARVVKASYRETILDLNREMRVKYEHVLAFAVIDRELSVERQELTPSMKIRVQNVLEGSEKYLDAIYDPIRDCDCRFLSRIVRLSPDPRPCPKGKERTLDRCHECRPLWHEGTPSESPG